EAIADANIEFLGSVDNDTLRQLYRTAQALVLPAEEDFGIAPVEAMACGRPVVALGRGGAVETVEHGVTGYLVDRAEPEAFAEAMRAAAARAWDPAPLAARARGFGVDAFETRFAAVVAEAVGRPC